MSGYLFYRLVIRDPSDTFDQLVLSSHPDDDNPFLTAPPEGDGESIDPITGKVGLAEYVWRVADEIGTLTAGLGFTDEDWSYANSTARNAVWPVTQSDATGSTSGGFGGTPLAMTINYGGGIGGGAGFVKFTRTITGTPGATVVVRCDNMTLSRAASEFNDNCGMGINGATGHVPASGLSGPVTVSGTFDGSGEATIVLGHFDLEFGMTPITITVGDLSWTETSDDVSARVVTALLGDSDGKWAGLNRKATGYESTDGTTWTAVHAGYLTQLILTGGIEYALHVGDSDRRERRLSLVSAPTGTGWSGTNIVGAPPDFSANADYPQVWRFRVIGTGDTDDDLPADAVVLKFMFGWALSDNDTLGFHLGDPNINDGVNLRLDDLEGEDVFRLDAIAKPFAFRNTSRQWVFGDGGDDGLIATVITTGGSAVGTFSPYGWTLPFAFGTELPGGGPYLLALNTRLALKWTGTLPSVDTQYDITVAPSGISEDSPLHFSGHPVRFVTTLFDHFAIPYDSASADALVTTLGDLLSVDYRWTATFPLWDSIEKWAFGPFGFAVRKATDGEWEFYATRTIPATEPSETIDETVIYDPKRPTLDLGSGDIVTQVIWKMKQFQSWTSDMGGDVPADGIVQVDHTFSVDNGDADADQHPLTYEVPGSISPYPIDPDVGVYLVGASQELLRRWGRGCPMTEVATLRSSGIAAKVGEFVVVDLDHKPTIDTTATPTGVRGGARICQVVHPTRKPAGRVLQLLDVGTATTNELVPEFTLAQGTDTRHAATATLTNDGDLAGYQVRIQFATGASEPSGGTMLALFDPDAVAHDLPLVSAGSTDWVRMRVELDGELPGAWSDWDSVALDAIPPVTGLSNSAGANDAERVLTWTVGDATLPVRVRWKATADATYLHSVTLPPGSNTYTITGIVPGTAMTAAVDHVENAPFAGDSADETTTWTAGSTTPTLTAPTNPQGFTDGNGTYGLRVTASVLPSRVVFMQAVEDSVGAGTYGTPVEVGSITSVAGAGACVITLTRPNDGLTVQLTAQHAKTGYTDSSDTTAVTLDPWETTATVPPETSALSMLTVADESAAAVNSRQLAVADGVSKTDAGAGSTLTLGLDDRGVALAKLAQDAATDGQAVVWSDTSSAWVPGDVTVDLSSYAPLASPALTGTPTAPTAATGTDTTQLATTAFVQTELAGISVTGMTNPMTATGDLIVGSGTHGENRATVAEGASISTIAGTFGGNIANVIDESDATHWDSDQHFLDLSTVPQFIIDLGQARPIHDFRLLDATGGAGATAFTIESGTSSSGPWTTRYTSGARSGGDTTLTALTTPATARYWQVTATNGSAGSGWVVYTCELCEETLAVGTPVRLPPGTDIQVLTLDATARDGVKWSTPATGGSGAVILYDSGALASPQNSIDTGVGGIAGGYNVLEFWLMGRTDEVTAFSTAALTFNADSGNNYDRQHLGGRSGSASVSFSGTRANVDLFVCGASYDTGAFGIIRGTIPFYAETTAHKALEVTQATVDSNSARAAAEVYVARWRNTAAITRMTFTAPSGKSFIAGSHLIVYGR